MFFLWETQAIYGDEQPMSLSQIEQFYIYIYVYT